MDSESTGPKRRLGPPLTVVAVAAVLAAGGGGAYWASTYTSGSGSGTGQSSGAPGGGQSAGIRTMAIQSYTASGTTLTVRLWSGVCGTYSASADESAGSVTVRVTSVPGRPGRVCAMIAKRSTETVRLDKPLGDREVIDASDGKTVKAGGYDRQDR